MKAVTRAVATAAILCALALAGCGSPARAPGPPGQTVVLLENRVDGPCQLVWANARVDDRALERTTIAPPGAPPASLDRPILRPGEHTVSIAASASCGGAEPATVLHVTQPVYMSKEGGTITITIARDAASPSGLSARFAVGGGEVLAPRADGGEVDCRARLPVDRAICRTEAALAHARRDRDVVRALCLGEKLREMRLLAETTAQNASALAVTEANLANVDEDATRRVLVLASEAEKCIGAETMGQEGMFVIRSRHRALNAFY
jgi:hypothetical protein